MKINLTKKNVADLEKTVALLQNGVKTGLFPVLTQERRDAKELAVDLQNILIKHDERQEKEY